MQELPDIELDTSSARISQRAESKGDSSQGLAKSFLLALTFIAIVLPTLIVVGITLVGKEPILSLFGVTASEKPDPYKQQLALLESELSSLRGQLNTLVTDLSTQSASVSEQAFEQDKLEKRLTVVERFSSDLEQKIKKQQAAQAELVVKKKVVSAKPKPAPVIPPILMSIRNISGVSYVALREGLDASELLMPGDTWKGWTFIDADPVRKVARFRYQNQMQELWL